MYLSPHQSTSFGMTLHLHTPNFFFFFFGVITFKLWMRLIHIVTFQSSTLLHKHCFHYRTRQRLARLNFDLSTAEIGLPDNNFPKHQIF
jgi:hypothetical protein